MTTKPLRGSIEWVGSATRPSPTDHWRARVTVEGRRRWVNLPPTITRRQEQKARSIAAEMANLAVAGRLGAPPPPKPSDPAGETLSAWSARWFASRENRGLSSIRADRGRFTTWVLPRLGHLAVAAITRPDVEAWVEWIDTEVQRGALAWKTAHNAWGLLSRALAEASGGKVRALRCRDDNPARGVAPPDRGVSRAKQFLYPDEFLKLVECVAIPLAVRRTYAFTVYLYPRAGEVEALHWEDFDLEHSTVQIHRALDPDDHVEHETKGKASRRFEIEPALVPLLRAMRAERPHDDRVFSPWPLFKHRAGQLRVSLRTAGVTRPELFANDLTRKHLTFHDLRATGATWAAMRGDDPLRIMHRAGHRDLQTTMLYVRAAENLRREKATPFPPLPASLIGHVSSDSRNPVSQEVSQEVSHAPRRPPRSPHFPVTSAVRGEGFEPP